MNKILLTTLLTVIVSGCETFTDLSATKNTQTKETDNVASVSESCPGSTEIPAQFAQYFQAVDDQELLDKALGEAGKGGLCKGQVYESTQELPADFFRAWNSTNPNSEFGQWWAFFKPEGSTSEYREQYEICFQWSPLDRLVSCPLKAQQKIVVGPGQSAYCSQYLSYPASEALQIFIADAANAFNTDQCLKATDHFNWVEN